MKKTVFELTLNRWPYGLELRRSERGLLLCPRRKARADWPKAFRRRRPTVDDLAAARQLANEFDAKEWEW